MQDVSENPLWKEQLKTRVTLRDITLKHWLENNLFTPVWWLMLITFIIVWFIWWKFVNKNRFLEIVTYGLLVTCVTIILDIVGAEFALWGYPNMLVPTVPPLFIVDLGFLPVIYMFIYQYFSSWTAFTIAISITSFFISFIGEPIAVWLDMYELNNWQHVYSFPIYISMALILKWVLNKIMMIRSKSK